MWRSEEILPTPPLKKEEGKISVWPLLKKGRGNPPVSQRARWKRMGLDEGEFWVYLRQHHEFKTLYGDT